ncbi:MAG: ATP-binding protein [Actinomycetota bacterium]
MERIPVPQSDSPHEAPMESRLPAILADLPAAVAVLDGPDHVFTFANELYVQMIGGRNPVGLPVRDALPEIEGVYLDLLDEVYTTGKQHIGRVATVTLDRRGDGNLEEAFVNFVLLPTLDAQGATRGILVHSVEVTDMVLERRQSDALARILELIATGAPSDDQLRDLVLLLEGHGGPGLAGSILLLDSRSEHLRHGAAPSLPAEYNAAVDGTTIGPLSGSFGAAAYTGNPVEALDIASDPRWPDLREAALEAGLTTCWSTPIVSTKGELLGVLSGYATQQEPLAMPADKLVETVVRTAAIAIERSRLEEEREALFASERSAREKAESRAQAAISLEYVADGVCLLDTEGVVRLWNPTAARVLGIPEERIVGRPILELVPDWESVSEQVRAARDLATTVTIPIQRAGRELWLSTSGVSFEGGTVYAFRDVTAEHEIEAIRADIVATVSHELRTPLAAVYGAAKTLQRPDIPPEQASSLIDLIGSESERLRVLVDEILLASQLESDHGLSFDLESLDVADLASGLVDGMTAATGRTIRLELPGAAAYALANEQRLQQVLANLIDNAVKYGGRTGEISLSIQLLERSLRIDVRDEGPGIPFGEQDRIFEKFYRLDPNQRQGIGGTGLGLYICRELVERMRGRIWVESSDGTGSVFSVELPRAST